MQAFSKENPVLMGIINLTPDSFSDGGRFNTLNKAIERAKQLVKDGSIILDIGGESSGPNTKNVSLKEELKRVIPILKAIRKTSKITVSIDTYKAEVALLALKEGANMINDVTSLRGNKKMAKVIAKSNCKIILMYSKDKNARTTIKKKEYKDVIATIKEFFIKRINYAKKQGIRDEQIILDPGMGHFISSIPKYSYEIICGLPELMQLGYPILIGISRKSLLGGEIELRDKRGKGLEALAYMNGASIIRTHDVRGLKKYLCQICN